MAEKKRGPGRPPGSKNKKTKSKSVSSGKAGPKAKEKAKEIQSKRKADRRVIDEIWAIISIALGVFLIVATFTNGAGELGEIIGNFLKGLFGFIAYVLPFYLIIFGVLLFARRTVSISLKTSLLLFILILMFATMNSTRFIEAEHIKLSINAIKGFYTSGEELKSGGFFGMILASVFIKWLGKAGCWILTTVVTLICLLLIINTPVSRFVTKIGDKMEERKLIRENSHLDEEIDSAEDDEKTESAVSVAETKAAVQRKPEAERTKSQEWNSKRDIKIVGAEKKENSVLRYMQDDTLFDRGSSAGTYGLEEHENYGEGYGVGGAVHAVTGFGLDGGTVTSNTGMGLDGTGVGSDGLQSDAAGQGLEPDRTDETPVMGVSKRMSDREASEAMLSKEELNSGTTVRKYKKPPISLLDKAEAASGTNKALLTDKAHKLEETLRNFKVDAHVLQVTQGPTVTRYEIQPAVGVKVGSIVKLSNDIALNMEAKSIRIEAPIPGKAAVGIEVENEKMTMVHIREIVDSTSFRESKSKITFAVGKDIAGKAIVADLKAMPHLLIAGSTGSGKSVCINGIITSLMYKADPEEVKLILIDPKVVELGNYNGIPHLMIPVVTDPAKAAAALNWAVAEMTDRYKKFAEEGVKDLESYNEWVRANDEKDKAMPQIVIIIDELADLMMAAPSQIEESICRLAQMARAAGMHLIVATQRPSVDVITGVIKANIPSRIAFAVSSQVDSRTILDMNGAEKLVGKGDMLFSPMGMGKPVRIQGAFISDREVHKVIEFVKKQVNDAEYNKDVIMRIEKSEVGGAETDSDELLPDAIELVVSSGQASVSMLQRRFRIGYNRAARIMDMMESRNIVGKQDGSRPRQVLVTEEELNEMKQNEEEI